MTCRAAAIVAVAVLLAAAVAGGARAQGAADSVRAARIKADVRSILASPDYQVEVQGSGVLERIGKGISDSINAVFQAIGRFLRRFSFNAQPDVRIPPILPQIIFALFVGLLVVGLAWAVVAIVRWFGTRERGGQGRRKKATVTEEAEEEGEPEHVAVDTWLDAARRHAAAGDYRRAYRAVFLAMLLRLDRAGAIRFERSRTNGEYLRALRTREALHDAVRPAARDFDIHWYGQLPIAEPDYARITEQYQRVVALIPSP